MESKAVDSKSILQHPTVIEVQPASPRYTVASTVAGAARKIAIPVDLSDESAYAVKWAVENYLRPGDAVTLIHVRPTSVLYGADWGSTHFTAADDADSESGDDEIKKKKKLEDEFDSFTAGKIAELAQPLVDSKVGFKVHVVKDHDMKERLCLEIERLGMSVVIMGSRGFGASRRDSKSIRLGSVSDYCVHHCICPVVVVRYPEQQEEDDIHSSAADLHPVPEEEEEEDPDTHTHHVSKLHLHSD